MRETGSLLPAELSVVGVAHLVGPAVSVRHRERDAAFSKDLLEGVTAHGSFVCQRFVDLVSEHPLEPARREVLAPQLPVGHWPLGLRQHLQALVAHQIIVQLPQPVLPRGVPLEAPAREIVVVYREDVCVGMSSSGVPMHGDEVVGRMHPLDQLDSYVSHPVEVVLIGHVELVGVKRQHVGLELVLPSVSLSEALGASDEVLRLRTSVSHRQREGDGPRLPVGDELLPNERVATVEHIADGSGGVRRGTDVHRTHVLVRSPRAARNSFTAPITARRRSPSTAAPLRSA
ncbi:hypothetical protein GCM10009551_105830 [Nocardiopsis tropica]